MQDSSFPPNRLNPTSVVPTRHLPLLQLPKEEGKLKGRKITKGDAKSKYKGNPRDALKRSRSTAESVRDVPSQVFGSYADLKRPLTARDPMISLTSPRAKFPEPSTPRPIPTPQELPKKKGSWIPFLHSQAKSVSSEKKQKKKNTRRARSLSRPKNAIHLSAHFQDRSTKQVAHNLLLAFTYEVSKPNPYDLLVHRPEEQFRGEVDFEIFLLALRNPNENFLFDDKYLSSLVKKAWKSLRSSGNFLLSGSRARIERFQKTLSDNPELKESKSPRSQKEFIQKLEASLETLLKMKTVGLFLKNYEKIECPLVKEIITHIIHPEVIERLKKYKSKYPSMIFGKEFEQCLYLTHYLHNTQESYSKVVVSETETSLIRISANDIRRTYNVINTQFGFREIILDGEGENLRTFKRKSSFGEKETGKKSYDSIPLFNDKLTAEDNAINVFNFLTNEITNAKIHCDLPYETMRFIAREIVSSNGVLNDESIPILADYSSTSESEEGKDTLNSSGDENSKPFIMKIFQSTSFGHSQQFLSRFIEEHPGIFELSPYNGLFNGYFTATFPSKPESRALKIGSTKYGFYSEQIFKLQIAYKGQEFLTYSASGRTEYNSRTKEFTFHDLTLSLDEDSLVGLVKNSKNSLGIIPFHELKEMLQQFIVVMRYRDKKKDFSSVAGDSEKENKSDGSQFTPYDFHPEWLLARFNYISDVGPSMNESQTEVPTFPTEKYDTIRRLEKKGEDTDDEDMQFRFSEDENEDNEKKL